MIRLQFIQSNVNKFSLFFETIRELKYSFFDHYYSFVIFNVAKYTCRNYISIIHIFELLNINNKMPEMDKMDLYKMHADFCKFMGNPKTLTACLMMRDVMFEQMKDKA